MRTDQARNIFFVVAVGIFLLFVGTSVYPIVYPFRHWHVECFRGGTAVTRAMPDTQYNLEKFTAEAKKRGEDPCNVMPHRDWYWRPTVDY